MQLGTRSRSEYTSLVASRGSTISLWGGTALSLPTHLVNAGEEWSCRPPLGGEGYLKHVLFGEWLLSVVCLSLTGIGEVVRLELAVSLTRGLKCFPSL
jgi:hypothetical protein